MKQITICTTLLIFSAICFSQQTNPGQSVTKQHYLEKSKHQKTAGWILAGGGVILEISGAIAYQYGNASILLLGAGLLSQVASIPFFISAAINKHKSKKASLSLKFEKTPGIQPAGVGVRSNPEITLKINL